MKKFIKIVVFLLIVSVIFSWVYMQSNDVPEEISIDLPWIKSPEHVFLYHESIVDKYKLETNRGSHMVAENFRAGLVDYGFISGDTLVIARQKGVPLQALFVVYPRTPTVLVSLKEKGINVIKDLVGKKVGVIKTSTTYPQYHRVLDLNGINKSEVIEIDAIQGGLEQLVNGEVDALVHYENYAPIKLKQKGHEVGPLIYFHEYIDMYSTVFAASNRVLSENPEEVEQVVNSLLVALYETKDNPDEAIQSILAREGSSIGDLKYIKAGLKAFYTIVDSSNNPIGYMDRDGWKATVESLKQTGQISGDIDLDKYFYDMYIKKYL